LAAPVQPGPSVTRSSRNLGGLYRQDPGNRGDHRSGPVGSMNSQQVVGKAIKSGRVATLGALGSLPAQGRRPGNPVSSVTVVPR